MTGVMSSSKITHIIFATLTLMNDVMYCPTSVDNMLITKETFTPLILKNPCSFSFIESHEFIFPYQELVRQPPQSDQRSHNAYFSPSRASITASNITI